MDKHLAKRGSCELCMSIWLLDLGYHIAKWVNGGNALKVLETQFVQLHAIFLMNNSASNLSISYFVVTTPSLCFYVHLGLVLSNVGQFSEHTFGSHQHNS
jgi:hypothetical protein